MKTTHQIVFAMNRKTKRAVLLAGYSCYEQVQGWFQCGILMPDGTRADGIGRCKSAADFQARSGIEVLATQL